MTESQRIRRLGAAVRPSDLHPPTRHFAGLPAQLGGSPKAMGWPVFVMIEDRADGFFLLRFAESLEVVGDTWHQSEDEAKEQAHKEYGRLLGHWRELTADMTDAEILAVLAEEEASQ